MDVVFAGQFENAFMRACDSDGSTPPRTGHPYYDSLRRPTEIGRFHRCGTFIALAERILLDQVDWVPGQGLDRQRDPKALGLVRDQGIPRQDDLTWFAAYLLSEGALDTAGLHALSIEPWPPDYPAQEQDETWEARDIPPVNQIQHSQLVRILDQVDLAGRTSSYLVLGDTERLVLEQISAFVTEHAMATPIDLPDLNHKKVVEAERFAGGLLNFCPPDIEAALAVRLDHSIQRYAARVRAALSSESCLDNHRSLVGAMREQLEESKRTRAAQTVFEITSLLLAPLPVGPVKLVPKGMSAWLKQQRRRRSWNVLMARMSDIAVEDYLRRTQNL